MTEAQSSQRALASTLLLIIGGALRPTPIRLLCGLLGAVVLVGWIAALIW